VHAQLAAVWEATGGLDGRAAAAEHRIHAAVGPSEIAGAAAAARELAAELVGEQQAQAARLLRAARGAAVECVDRPDLRAIVALDLAKAVRRLGGLDLALEYHQEAAKLARDSSDLVLRARTEVGAHLWVNAFVPDPTRLRRLEEVLADLPAEELRLRAEVLGRLAVVGGADLDDVDRARAWADEALDVARRVGDPVLVAQALLNRTMAPGSRAELDTRLVVADEVVGLAERAGRSDLAYYGHQRRFCHHLNRGDVGAANHAIERAELLARLLPSPGWRHRALVRRTTLLAVVGSRQAAMASMDEAVQIGAGPIEPIVLLCCELLHRLMLLELYGGADPRAEEVYRTLLPLIDDVPSGILQVQKGFAAQRLGDEARVQDVLLRYGREPERILRSLSGDQYLRMLCDTIARAGATSLVGPAYDALLPYAGLLNIGGAESVGLPVDDVLGRLAALAGDAPAAVHHARDAVALARSLPSPPMLVHCLDHLADALARAGDGDSGPSRAEAAALALAAGVERAGRECPPAAAAGTRSATLRREGPQWVLTSPLGAARLADSTGLGQLARLLDVTGVEVAAVELAAPAYAPVAAGLGPALDGQAKRAYRQRLAELQAEVDDAEACNDPVRGERAHVEIDALLRELRRAVGLGGRDRPTASDVERSRVNVVRSLRRATTAIAQQAPELARHLEVSLRTGRYCSYSPEPAAALSWTVDS